MIKLCQHDKMRYKAVNRSGVFLLMAVWPLSALPSFAWMIVKMLTNNPDNSKRAKGWAISNGEVFHTIFGYHMENGLNENDDESWAKKPYYGLNDFGTIAKNYNDDSERCVEQMIRLAEQIKKTDEYVVVEIKTQNGVVRSFIGGVKFYRGEFSDCGLTIDVEKPVHQLPYDCCYDD